MTRGHASNYGTFSCRDFVANLKITRTLTLAYSNTQQIIILGIRVPFIERRHYVVYHMSASTDHMVTRSVTNVALPSRILCIDPVPG